MGESPLDDIQVIIDTYADSVITDTLMIMIISLIFQNNLFATDLKSLSLTLYREDKLTFKNKLISSRTVLLSKISLLGEENKKSKQVYIKLINLLTNILNSDIFKNI